MSQLPDSVTTGRRAAIRRRVTEFEEFVDETDPADAVHDVVVEAMGEVGIDVSTRTPREVTPEELAEVTHVITMGCSADDACPATWRGDSRDWDLDDPAGRDIDRVRAIRGEIETRVEALFDEIER